jgi:DNA modification methylase
VTELHNGDCIEKMKAMRPACVDLVLTDPPYNLSNFMKKRATNLSSMRKNFFGSSAWDALDDGAWEKGMDNFFHAAGRVVRKGGAFIVFSSIIKVETLIRIAARHRLYYKTTGVWHKRNPMPRNWRLHFINSTEAWIYFINRERTGTYNNDGKVLHDFFESTVAPPAERKHGKHPTQKPLALTDFFVQTLTNPGGIVLDPFMGSGTSGVSAVRMKRGFIGVEADKEYFEIAKARISEAETAHNNR